MEYDFISRRAIFQELLVYDGRVCPDNDIDGFQITIDVNRIKNAITKIHAADVAPVVHGYWKVGGINPWDGTVGNWLCSVCDGVSLKNSDYCPNCGAKMDGGKLGIGD